MGSLTLMFQTALFYFILFIFFYFLLVISFEVAFVILEKGIHFIGNLFHKCDIYKACPSESGTEVGAPLFPVVELCDFSGRWQCMSGEIWYTLDSGSVLLTETEAR